MPIITAPDPEFMDQITELESVSKAADEAAMLIGQRKWMYPPLQGWDGDPRKISDMNKAFVRKNLNKTYVTIMSDTTQKGTIGEIMILKLQIDYIASLERAFRTRFCSSVRARMHSAARRRGQGNPQGLFTGSIVLWLKRILTAAHFTA